MRQSTDQHLTMTFDPNTIEHLGIRMYSTLPPVLGELIANSYDANATEVNLSFKDDAKEKEIIISDNGDGMNFGELNAKFLKIGRNRREEDGDKVSRKGRKAIGKKGLGKLSFFGIANEIEIATKKDGKLNVFIMRWEDLKKSNKEYEPQIVEKNKKCDPKEHGTTLILRKLQRESKFVLEDIAISLSKIFIMDSDFKINLRHNSGKIIKVTNEGKYFELDKQIEWDVPEDIKVKTDYKKKKEVKGHLIATEKPISPKTNMRGITLFSRKKLVNQAEYFSDSTSSHFFSYLTGWLEIDFIDDLPEDVIATNRQSLNWNHPEIKKLREYLQKMIRWLERDWREKRDKLREKKLTEKTGINISDWYGKLPEDLREKVKPIIDTIVKESEAAEETTNRAVVSFHKIVPEYPYYHWRHLHPEIQKITEECYKDKRYFEATDRAAKLYILRVKDKAGVDAQNDSHNMTEAFKPDGGKLIVTKCVTNTEKNIQLGQHMLSTGIVAGCRNPLDHSFPDYEKKLVDTGLFTEKDCLDMLSIISHLFTRLDKAQKR